MKRQFYIALVGAVAGFLYAYVTRPTIPLLNIQIPLGILQSTAPLDQPLKNMLMEHIVMNVGIGFIVFGVLADLLERVSGNRSKA